MQETIDISQERLSIRPFRASDQEAVRHLVLSGLEEHWGTLDLRFNHDLDDIASTFVGDTVLIACLDQEIVGCGMLVRENDNVGRIVRMSVARHKRRLGIGQMILWHLVQDARKKGYRQIVLETTETWQDAVSFYERNGFTTSHFANGDRHFVLDIE